MTHPPTPDDDLLRRALKAERFYAFPPELAVRILEERLAARWSLGARVLGLVGAVTLAVGTVAARTGGLPAAPEGLPTDWIRPPVALPAGELWAAAPTVPAWLSPWLAPAAVALFIAGLLLARRWARDLGGPAVGGAR